MNKMKRTGLFGAAAITVLALVLTAKTLTFTPGDIGNGAGIKQAPLPAINHSGAIKHLSEAIRFETVSHQDPASNDQAAWQNLHVWLRQTYPAVHQKLTLKPIAEHSLIYRWQGSDPDLPPIILMAHQDVVPVTAGTEKDWKYPPFSGQIADNAVWGRGSVDDKGSLIALFEAVEALVLSGFQPRRTIYLVSGHDEEVGGSGAKAAAEYLARTEKQILFTLDEGAAVVNDEPLTKAPLPR